MAAVSGRTGATSLCVVCFVLDVLLANDSGLQSKRGSELSIFLPIPALDTGIAAGEHRAFRCVGRFHRRRIANIANFNRCVGPTVAGAIPLPASVVTTEAPVDIDNRLMIAGRIHNHNGVIEMIDDLFQDGGIQAFHRAKSVKANDRNFKDLYP